MESDLSNLSNLSPKPTNQRKTHSLEDILREFGPIEQVLYTPFQTEQPRQPAQALLPSTFTTQPYPYDYFTLFFTLDLFRTITTNTNRYANTHRIYTSEEGLREWSDLLVTELYVFIGAMSRNAPLYDHFRSSILIT